MKSYRRLRLFAMVALCIELAVGLGGALAPRAEIFPLASWFLFSLVPGSTSDYDLVLRAQGDTPLEPPLRFSQANRYIHTPNSIVAYELIQQFGRAVQARDAKRVRSLRPQIEAQFLAPGIRYDLVKATFRPVARWESDQTLTTAVLGSYTAGQP